MKSQIFLIEENDYVKAYYLKALQQQGLSIKKLFFFLFKKVLKSNDFKNFNYLLFFINFPIYFLLST